VVRDRSSRQWRGDVRQTLQQHKQDGDTVFLVSGGPEGLLQRIAEEVGADYVVGTQHEMVDGCYTGQASNIPCQGENKVLLTKQRIHELGLPVDFQGSYAYADTVGDVTMLEMVGNPVAVYPDEKLSVIARERGWQVIEG